MNRSAALGRVYPKHILQEVDQDYKKIVKQQQPATDVLSMLETAAINKVNSSYEIIKWHKEYYSTYPVEFSNKDIVIDIGSNDGTTLGFYPENLTLIGIDPTAGKFTSYYKRHIRIITDFFSESLIKSEIGDKKAKVVSSFAMFYDLEDPVSFATQIRNPSCSAH